MTHKKFNGEDSHNYVLDAGNRDQTIAQALDDPRVDLDALIDWCDTQSPVCTDKACEAARQKVNTGIVLRNTEVGTASAHPKTAGLDL